MSFHDSPRACLVSAGALLLVGLGGACQEQGTPSDPPESSVCPACEPSAGGETSDFGGGTPTACGFVSKRAPIDAADAEALGYDLARVHELIGREIDAALSWTARPTEVGEPAQGYEARTRVRGRATAGAYEHWRPDPEFCDGTTCTREDTSVEQATCPDFLWMELEVELETEDGAISVVASGEVVQWNDDPRFEPMIGGDAGAYPIGHAYANLLDVDGMLRLFPPPEAFEGDPGPSATQAGHPFAGTLTIGLEFKDDATHGLVSPSIRWEVVDEHGGNEVEDYEPLVGTWPAEE